MKRISAWLVAVLLLLPSIADAVTCGVWAIRRGDRVSKEFNGDQSGYNAALTYVGTSTGLIVIYPGCGGINIASSDLPDSALVIRYDGGKITYYSNSPANDIIELSEANLTNAAKPTWSNPSITMAPGSKWYWREYQTPFTKRAFLEKDTNNVATIGCTGIGPLVFQPNNVQVMRMTSAGVRIGDNQTPSTPLDVNGTATFRSVVTYGTPATLADNTTPSVAGGTVFKCTPAGSTTITTFTGGVAGQIITIIFTNANATLQDSGTLKLAGASTNFVSTADDTMVLEYDGTNWFELDRSVN